MNIHNFRWDLFWETFYYLNWFEAAAIFCFGIYWPFSLRKMRKTKQTEGKSLVLPWLFIIGCAFAIYDKLFYNLDLVILLYVAFACFAFVYYRTVKRLRLWEAANQRRSDLVRRGRSSGSGSGRSHHRRRRHERRHESGSGAGERLSKETKDSLRSNAEEIAPKEPKFADQLKLDDE